MNRSILIVICDFLLVSLITFSNLDNLTPEKKEAVPVVPKGPDSSGKNDIVGAMRTALEEELREKQKLSGELSNARQTVQQQQNLINQREGTVREVQEKLERTQVMTSQLQMQRQIMEQQISAAQKNLQSLQGELSNTRATAQLSEEQLQAYRANLEKQVLEAEALKQKMAELEKSHNKALAEKQQLDAKAQVAEAEKRMVLAQVSAMKSEVETVRAEKAQLQANTAKLAEGVSALAEQSGALTQEIRENRPLPANAIFHEFSTNRVDTEFHVVREGVFNKPLKRSAKTRTVLVNDGTQTFALYHIADTPLALHPPGIIYEGLTGTVRRGEMSSDIPRVSFLTQDPRIMVMPLSPAEAAKLGSKIYPIAPDPFKFGEAVLVGAAGDYYGESKFVIDPTTPRYVKMDRSFFKGLFGKFNPSRGDLVFSKTGQLLGVMANDEYCVVLGQISPEVTLMAGDNLRAQQAGQWLDQLGTRLRALPFKLQ